jgi:hypothetical protein
MKLIPFDTKPSAEHATDLQALFNWAEEVLRGQFEKLQRATSREELEAIKFDADDLTVIMAIHDALHSGKEKNREKHFENMNDSQLKAILRSKFNDRKKDRKQELIEGEKEAAAAEEAREKREAAKFYGASSNTRFSTAAYRS